jgi:hypothetical protein
MKGRAAGHRFKNGTSKDIPVNFVFLFGTRVYEKIILKTLFSRNGHHNVVLRT